MKQFLPTVLIWLFQTIGAWTQSGPLDTCTSICHGSLGDNIYPNGDFGSGIPNVIPVNPGLAPGYTYQTNPPPNDGYYSIANSTTPWGWFASDKWINIEDNGPEPNGYMMVVNASYPPGMFFQNTVPVCENTLYEFSVDVINIFESYFTGTIYPNLTFVIDNVAYCETGDITNDAQWHTVRFSFTTAPGQTSLLLGMRNNAPGGYGNDLAIDNISFRACGPELLAPDTLWFCAGSSAQLELQTLNSPFSTTAYQWQVFLNGIWEDIPGANSLIWNLLNPQDDAEYRLLVASATPNLAVPNCRIVSQAIRLAQMPALVVSASGSDVLCFGQGSASVAAQTFSGQAPYQYAWSNGSTEQMMTGVSAGNYLVTITDALGCSATTSVTVNEAPQLVAGIISLPVSCFNGSDGQAIVAASGGTSPYAFSWENGSSGDTIQGLSAGNYQLTITDGHGCSSTASGSIGTPSELTPIATGGISSCFGVNDGIATVLANGGTIPYTFLWSGGQTDAQISGLSAGNYLVTVTDAHGCSASTSGSISEPLALLPATSGGVTSCFGGNDAIATASASGGTSPYAFQWSSGQTDAQISGLSAGNYLVTVTDALGCSASTSGNISEPPTLLPAANGGTTSCFGGNDAIATASASGGTSPYAFQWSSGQTGAQISGLSAGNYLVTVTDAHGCSANTSVSISDPPALVPATSAGATSCFGGNDAIATASASGGTGPYTFIWSSGQTSAQANGLSAGPYTLTLTDAQGCSATATGNIQEPGLLVANTLAGTVSCFGGNNASVSAQCTGGTGPYQFLWNNGLNTAQIGGLSAGIYAVTATDAHGCTAVQWASVDQSALLVSTAVSAATDCFGGIDGALSIQSNGGQAPYQYQWSNGQSGTSIIGLPAGLYAVTTTDALGCTTMNTTVVGQPTPVVLNVTSGSVSCFGGANGTLLATTGGGTGPYSIAWSDGQSGITANGLSAGTYTLTATDAQGCTASISAIVITPTTIVSGITAQDPDCFGGANGMATLLPGGGTPPYSFQWQNGQTGASAQQLSAGTYQVTATDSNGCTHTNSISLSQPTIVSGNIQALEAGCFGAATGQAWGSASGGVPPYSFTWQNGQTTAQINGLTSGWYGLSITDAHQCVGKMQVWVGQPTPLSVVPVTQPVSCPEVANGMAYASASGGVGPYLFAWSNGQSGHEISSLDMGAYTVTATDAHSCTAVRTETVDSELPIEVDLGLDQTFFLGDALVLTAHTNVPPGEIQDYNWSGTGGSALCAGCYQYEFVPTESGCEQVIVTSVHGCQASDEVCFKLRPGRHIYVPNVFHPDDSGDNDFFTIYSDASVKQILYLSIYNRWGEELFLTKNIPTNYEPSGWDGNYRGNPMNPGVFVWVAEVEFIDGEVLFLKGDVTLVR